MEENNQVVNQIQINPQPVVEQIVQSAPTQAAEIKPYQFRKLSAKDIPTMLKVLKKIKINKFAECFSSEQVQKLIKQSAEENSTEGLELIAGGAVFLEIAQILIDGVAECGDEIFKLLSDTSNLSLKEVEELDFDIFVQMVIDFIKKEEFVGFIKAVSQFLK